MRTRIKRATYSLDQELYINIDFCVGSVYWYWQDYVFPLQTNKPWSKFNQIQYKNELQQLIDLCRKR